jgi:hypothetical protein
MDPSIDAPTRAEIETQTARLKLNHRCWNTAWMMVGGFFILLFFLFNLLSYP